MKLLFGFASMRLISSLAQHPEVRRERFPERLWPQGSDPEVDEGWIFLEFAESAHLRLGEAPRHLQYPFPDLQCMINGKVMLFELGEILESGLGEGVAYSGKQGQKKMEAMTKGTPRLRLRSRRQGCAHFRLTRRSTGCFDRSWPNSMRREGCLATYSSFTISSDPGGRLTISFKALWNLPPLSTRVSLSGSGFFIYRPQRWSGTSNTHTMGLCELSLTSGFTLIFGLRLRPSFRVAGRGPMKSRHL